MKVRTLAEIRCERGGAPHGFVLMVTGALPDDPRKAKAAAAEIRDAVDDELSKIEESVPGMELTGLMLRVETVENYIKERLPNAGD